MFESTRIHPLVSVISWFDCGISIDTSVGTGHALDAPRSRHQQKDSRHTVHFTAGRRVRFSVSAWRRSGENEARLRRSRARSRSSRLRRTCTGDQSVAPANATQSPANAASPVAAGSAATVSAAAQRLLPRMLQETTGRIFAGPIAMAATKNFRS